MESKLFPRARPLKRVPVNNHPLRRISSRSHLLPKPNTMFSGADTSGLSLPFSMNLSGSNALGFGYRFSS